MSENEDKDSKTEDPTEKKLSDANDKGNVPFSREVPAFASVLAALFFIVFYLPDATVQLVLGLKSIFEKSDEWRIVSGEDALAIFKYLYWEANAVLLPAFTLLILFGVAASVFQNVPRPVLDRVQPKLSKISITKGFGRIYSKKGMVEFAKSLSKIIVISTIIGISMQDEYFSSLTLMYADPANIIDAIAASAKKIFIIVLLCTAVLAIVDIFSTKHFWYEDLRMSKQEIKDEFKQSDGDPALKARQRSLARDRARQRMMSSVPRATLVIANPTHYAVALRYDPEESGAPIVVAMGKDLIALKIREIAENNDIPVFEDPPLARSMFAQVSLDSLIPPVFYKAVAELIQLVYNDPPKRRA